MASGPSHKARQFTESVIREMTRQAREHGAVNLAQGFPDFGAPAALKDAAATALHADINQYAITWGAKRFRDAIDRWRRVIDLAPSGEFARRARREARTAMDLDTIFSATAAAGV